MWSKINKTIQNKKKSKQAVFFINEAYSIEVSVLVDKVNVNKATDIYGIPLKLVKVVAGKLKDNLALSFNFSIEQRIFPGKLKTGLILLICYCLLLKQVIDSHKFKPTDVFTGTHIYNTNATKTTE